MNKIILIGNVSTDPEQHETANGKAVCTFNLAVNRKYSGADGERQTDFFRINAWRQLGEVCAKHLSKGKKVAVVGELQARLYDAKNGEKRMSLDVAADEVEFLSPKEEKSSATVSKGKVTPDDQFTDIDTSDLPF